MKNCPVCNCDQAYPRVNYQRDTVFWDCPICGKFELDSSLLQEINQNHLASYLYYNAYRSKQGGEPRYHSYFSEVKCVEYRTEYERGDRTHGIPVHLDSQTVENWYPRTFSERVDAILLCLNRKAKHIGESIALGLNESFSLLFVDRKEKCEDIASPDYEKNILRDEDACEEETRYMLNFLFESGLIRYTNGPSEDDAFEVTIAPAGYSRIDELLKYTSNGRNVLVAMQFGDETNALREAIRQGINDAKYHAVFIDEVQHNDFITPELLKYIRDSKFVVVDLTHQNSGAYFEEGYAMGLGKPVIQLCKKDTKLHFDIAQKNTIMWGTEDEIPIKLHDRIKATID